MLLTFFPILLASVAVAQISITTPQSLVQCETTTISWSGGTAPYYIYVYPEFYLDEISFLERLGPTNEMKIEYTAKVPARLRIRLNVRDATSIRIDDDGSDFTAVIAIRGDNSCLQEGVGVINGLPTLDPAGPDTSSAPDPSFETAVPPPFFGTSSAIASQGPAAFSSPSTRGGMTSGIASQGPAAYSSPAALPTGPRSGDGPAPVNGDAPNSGSALDLPSMPMSGGLIGISGVLHLLL